MPRLNGMLDRLWFVAAVFAVGSLAPAVIADAGENTKSNEESVPGAAADECVSEAVRASAADEIVGDEKSRASRLDAEIEAKPDAAELRWQRGWIKTADGWRDAADVQVKVTEAEKKYHELRDRLSDDLAGHKQLARFCKKNKLTNNARGHWQRVLSFNPDDAEARKALAHVRFEGTWVTKEETKRVEKVRKEYSDSLTVWSRKVPGWIKDWRSDDAKKKEKGRESLMAIRDAAAIPLLHAGLAYRSEEDTVLLVEILCNIPDVHATRIIAEIAVASQSPQILEMCVEELKHRDENAFAPQLLLALSSPTTSEMRLEMDPNTGRLLYRHVFTREEQFTRQVQTIGRDYGFVMVQDVIVDRPVDWGDLTAAGPVRFVYGNKEEIDRNRVIEQKVFGNEAQQQSAMLAYQVARTAVEAMNRERRKVLENLSIEDTNRRVGLVLSKVFDENYGSPDQWWKWWNQRHETQQLSQKPTRMQVQYDQQVDGYQLGPALTVEEATRQGILRFSCFAAGTPLATPEGLKPIESMKTGDLVLAQDVETGEITWKPVIQPTKRQSTEVLKLTIGDESVVCSLKHPFWKTGRGWIWAKDLVIGDLVRTSNGSLPITEVEEQPNAPVFNLIVSDFNTYFVGKNRTLTHDITYRRPTLAIAPGVRPAKEEVATK